VDPVALDLKSLLRPALYFPESMSVLSALEQFKTSRIHFALVVDEYGGVEGFILHQLGAIPKPGQHFEWGPYRFEVMDIFLSKRTASSPER
jgi:CBS domain containing-hemolysin-like protein